jgi:hypothetical protein
MNTHTRLLLTVISVRKVPKIIHGLPSSLAWLSCNSLYQRTEDKSPYPIQPTYQHIITIRSYYRRASDRSEVETNNNQTWYSYTPGKAGVRPKTTTRRRNKNYAPSRLARYNGVWRSEITRRICVGPTSTTGRHVAIRFGWHRRQLRRRGGGGGRYHEGKERLMVT